MSYGDRQRTIIISTKMYQYFVNQTDRPDNTIRLLKTDLNLLINLLEIDQATFFYKFVPKLLYILFKYLKFTKFLIIIYQYSVKTIS